LEGPTLAEHDLSAVTAEPLIDEFLNLHRSGWIGGVEREDQHMTE
jgi:hypothetical protein